MLAHAWRQSPGDLRLLRHLFSAVTFRELFCSLRLFLSSRPPFLLPSTGVRSPPHHHLKVVFPSPNSLSCILHRGFPQQAFPELLPLSSDLLIRCQLRKLGNQVEWPCSGGEKLREKAFNKVFSCNIKALSGQFQARNLRISLRSQLRPWILKSLLGL